MALSELAVKLKTSIKELHLAEFDPQLAYLIVREEFSGESFFLESVEGTKKTARYSFLGFDPIFTFKSKGNSVEFDGKNVISENPYALLRSKFYEFDVGSVDLLPFSGGMVGYLGYDIVSYFENLPNLLEDDLDLPDSHFIIPKQIICFDHLDHKVYAMSHNEIGNLKDLLNGGFEKDLNELELGDVKTNMAEPEYENAVEKVKEYIRSGDIFQTVISRRCQVPFKGDEFLMYKALRKLNPSPYMFYLDFDETKIIGSSPEMLVRLDRRVLTTRPLAGTRPRGKNPEEDEKLKMHLLLDEKERAEHIMLVDLHRNDMGRVSKYGSVKVDELMGIEKYSHVQHIVSNVTSELCEDMDCFDALRSCFPAGTVSGAPKIRAMEIIEELEKQRRGPYAGVVGYFDFSGNMDFAITIRTIFTKGEIAYVQAGAGIVSDSMAENEFQETENKMMAMLSVLKGDDHD
jgi:anthranilate synthase component 1